MKKKTALLLTMALGVSCLAGCGSHTAEKSTQYRRNAKACDDLLNEFEE